jgi:uncharacterized protein (TIGR03663 family)
LMADVTADSQAGTTGGIGLSRTINLAQVSWMTIAWVAILVAGSALRLFQLGLATLSASEARKAYDAWSLVYGNTEGVHNDLTKTQPTGLLLRALSFFLFGDSDTNVRIPSALLGIGLIVLVWSIRDLLGEWRALGAAALVALSPTVVYASRTANEEIDALFFGVLLVVTIFRFGDELRTPGIGRAVTLGLALAALIGCGPSAINLLVTLIIMFGAAPFVSLDNGQTGKRAVARLTESRQLGLIALASFIVSLVILFTRFFSDPGAISGIGTVFGDWTKLVANATGSVSTQYFILTILLYEVLAVVFAIKVVFGALNQGTGRLFDWSYPAVWFLAALVLFSFSSGRQPEQAVLVAFPLLLLGGFGLGDTIETFARSANRTNRLGLLAVITFGLAIALISVLVLIGRVDSATDRQDAVVQVLAASIIALGPLVVLAYALGEQLGKDYGWPKVRAAVLIGVGALLSILFLRGTIELAFYRYDAGTELLAQNTSATDLRDITVRTANLSRDVNGTERSPANPAGGKELSIALDRTVQWPFRWYFRDYPNLQIVAPGQATSLDTQMVIAPDVTGMSEAGYTPRIINSSNTTSAALLDPSLGTVLKNIFLPSNWDSGFQFLLYRKPITAGAPATVVFGYSAPVTAKMSGERPTYKLTDRAGAGANPGQFNQPRGVAVSPDGSRIYVLDTQNGRVEIFDETGALVTTWGDGDDQVELEVTDNGLGPYGIATGADGLVYIADTWNHRIVVVNTDGQVVRTFGQFGNNEDSPDPSLNPGSFYGPRGITVYNNEVYVTDTGNERVEVFGLDGTFVRAWGGTGSAPNQLIEPVGITVGSDGRVYVADSGNARVSVFDTNGKPLAQWAIATWQGTQFFEPYLAADTSGHIFVGDPNSASIQVYDSDGTVVDTITEAGNDRIQTPAGMAITETGLLYVADRGASQVLTVDLNQYPDLAVNGLVALPGETGASPAASPIGSPEATPAGSPAG